MIVAISSQGENLTSMVDPRFGRARFFILFNMDDGSFEVLSNDENVNAAQGAGIQTTEAVAGKKPDLVVSGNVGPRAFAALSAAGIKIAVWSNGTVSEAIELIKDGKLKPIDRANVEGHWV